MLISLLSILSYCRNTIILRSICQAFWSKFFGGYLPLGNATSSALRLTSARIVSQIQQEVNGQKGHFANFLKLTDNRTPTQCWSVLSVLSMPLSCLPRHVNTPGGMRPILSELSDMSVLEAFARYIPNVPAGTFCTLCTQCPKCPPPPTH